MSILSKLLKKTLGIPEVKIENNDLLVKLVTDLIKGSGEVVFKPLGDFDVIFLRNALDAEILRRNKKKEILNATKKSDLK